ncbi:50S ribosomal protein L30 [soil metagenome]
MAVKKTAATVQPMLRITLVRSLIGRPRDQEATVQSLGLRRLHQTVEHPDSESLRGMVNKVKHLVRVDDQT